MDNFKGLKRLEDHFAYKFISKHNLVPKNLFPIEIREIYTEEEDKLITEIDS